MAFLPTPIWSIVLITLLFWGCAFIDIAVELGSHHVVAWVVLWLAAVWIYLWEWFKTSTHNNHINGDMLQSVEFRPPPPSESQIITLFAHGLYPANQALGYFFTNDDVMDTVSGRSAKSLSFRAWLLWLGSRIVRLPVFPNVHAVGGGDASWNVGIWPAAVEYSTAVLHCINTVDDTMLLLVGHSLGSAHVIAAIGLLAQRPDWEERIRPRIKHVVCLCPFATVSDVVRYRFSGPLRCLWSVATRVLAKYMGYHPEHERWAPFAMSGYFPQNVPLSLVWSRADEHVPATSAKRLYDHLNLREAAIDLRDPLILTATPHELPFATDTDHAKLARYLRDIVTA